MLKNFFITAFRNLIRNKTYTFINVLGLALGISSALVLFKFMNYHQSFDTHHSNYNELYRFVRHEISANSIDYDMGLPVPFAKAFASDYPDLGTVAIVQYANEGQFTVTNKVGNETKFTESGGIGFVEEAFFDLFDIELVAGNKETALDNPGHVILSAALVERYFGYTGTQLASALGQKVRLDNKVDLIISGVMEDIPENTDLPLTALVTFASADYIFPLFSRESWGSVSSSTNVYLLKNEAVDEEIIDAKLVELIAKYQPEETETEEIHLQPMSEIHFSQTYNTHGGENVSVELLWGCVITGIILILMACINFINLATAQAVKRAKEVGVRKVMGGSKVQLVTQFMSEIFMITIASVILSLGIAELVLNRLDWLLDYELTLDLLNDPVMLLYLGIIILAVTLLAGLYPSFVLSSLNPVAAMKRSKMAGVSGKFNLRRGLVVGQFFISQFLIICTLVVISQMKYFSEADMGFTKESIVSFNMPEPSTRNGQLLRNRLVTLPNIEALSFHVGSPLSKNNLGSNFNYEPLANETDFDAQFKIVDSHYLDLFEIKLLAGQNLTAADTLLKKTLITEKVMRMLGFEYPQDAIGVKVKTSFAGEKTIVGVVNDFHAYSLKSEIPPLFLIGYPGYNYEGAVKFTGNEDSYQKTIASIKQEWDEVFPEYTFDSYLFEDRIAENYEQEADILALFQVLAGIALFIGCLGLYGLISFMANQKTKEIGVRKVLGASVGQILRLFSNELLTLITISFVLAVPLGYYAMRGWLQDFEYSININVWVFVVAIGFTFLVSAITTGFRSLKAATANPVDSLRSE